VFSFCLVVYVLSCVFKFRQCNLIDRLSRPPAKSAWWGTVKLYSLNLVVSMILIRIRICGIWPQQLHYCKYLQVCIDILCVCFMRIFAAGTTLLWSHWLIRSRSCSQHGLPRSAVWLYLCLTTPRSLTSTTLHCIVVVTMVTTCNLRCRLVRCSKFYLTSQHILFQ